MTQSKAVLITGCSTGVGRATALRFLRDGRPVYATARDPRTLTELAYAGARTLRLDVTDEDSMAKAVSLVEEEHGAIGVLVNNAAYGQQGAMEAVSLDLVRELYETNLFGLIRLTQLALPAMRRQGAGRVLNVSAMGGHFTLPGTGVLHSSKHAVRAVSDALRLELRPFGIAVSMIEPGPVRTSFSGTANASIPGPTGGVYDRFHRDLETRMEAAYEDKVRRMVLDPDTVARRIVRAADKRRPRARYPVGVMCRGVIALRRLLPEAALDAVIRRMFPTPVA